MSHPRFYDDRPYGGHRPRQPSYNDRDERYDRYDSRDAQSSQDDHQYSLPSRTYEAANDMRRGSPRPGSSGKNYSDSRNYDNRRDYDDWDRGRHSRGREGQPAPRKGYEGNNYRDRDREGYRSPEDSRSRSASPRRSSSPYYGGPVSKEVMMDNVPLDYSATDIGKDLKKYYHIDDLEDIRIIRDHQTRQSRGFGFLRFPTVEKAKAFVEQNYPTLLLGDDDSDGDNTVVKIRIQYSRERSERPKNDVTDTEWVCKNCGFANFAGRRVCHKCQLRPADPAAASNAISIKQPEFANSGDSDVSTDGSPSQFLLVRSLEPSVTEELFAKGVAKLYKPNPTTTHAASNQSKKSKVSSTTGDANLGAREGSLRRILLVRDRRTNESWRYGFAEFASVEDAQAALTRYNSFAKFTIASKPIVASYIHAGVFVPVFNFEEGYEQVTFSPLGNASTRLQYWDENAYVSELVLSIPEKKRAHATETHVKSAADEAALAAQKEGLVALGEEAEEKTKKRKTEIKDSSKTKKATPAHLQFWSNRHAELHGIKSKDDDTSAPNDNAGNAMKSQAKKPEPSQPFVQSYANLEKKCCYLCSRQFKTEAEVNKHERLSELHRGNLQKADLKTQAVAKMKKAGLPIDLVINDGQDQDDAPEYRDRARERRAAFGSSNKQKISLPMKKQASDPTSTKIQKENNSKDDRKPGSSSDDKSTGAASTKSKGAALLGKMGWTSGQGLGASNAGITAPIATDLYVAGVGLGAEGGKVGDATEEAARNTKGGYSEFLDRTKEKAKERFRSMQ